ncbi:hypothetical protein [Acinetobacter baumannii]|uniref:hypothetical protein n=1 Tax=Acinetobacter baumannii TaxID=470 RepID=UPI000D65C910|nr:hypothetical protein [Acinetobacter baumannii]
MSNNKPLKNSSKLLVNLDKFIFLVNAADSLEEIEIIRDLCCDYFSHCKKSNYYTDIFDNAYSQIIIKPIQWCNELFRTF